MDTTDAFLDDSRFRIDVNLVDGLLAFLSGRRVITRKDAVLATAHLARMSFYAAEGFVTDLVEWPTMAGDQSAAAAPLVDALLDLRQDLMTTRLRDATHAAPGARFRGDTNA